MPRRTNSFARALKDAEKRLSRAQAELSIAAERVVELNEEIPRLRQIIASLSGKTPVVPVPGWTDKASTVPPELAKFVGPQDLTGMGSIPSQHPAPPMKIETEDDTLGEPEGEELSE